MIKAVLFDLIGTTVKTRNPDFIADCFKEAFRQHEVMAIEDIIRNNRGRNKLTMIHEILKQQNAPAHLAMPVHQSFNEVLQNNLDNFSEAEGLGEMIFFLKKRNIKIGIGSGLSQELFIEIYNHLGWEKYELDYTGTSETTGKSRPDPAMIFDMMKSLKIVSPEEVLKVGDTAADIQEGKNAGAFTAVILAGTQDENILKNESPDFVLNNLTDIQKIYLLN